MRPIYWATCFVLMLFLLGTDALTTAPATAPALKETLTVDLGGGVSMDFVLIHPGSFMMGSEKLRADEKPVHKVTITKPFYLGKYEVTQEQWQAVMGVNPSLDKGTKNPVTNVTWDDCQVFVKKLSEKAPLASSAGSGQAFKRPTEAQWEYACRAGSATELSYGDDETQLGEYAWISGNAEGKTHPVGQKKPNAWGLYDMYGNVGEWCSDLYGSYAPENATDPTGAGSGFTRVNRGGGVDNRGTPMCSAYRQRYGPSSGHTSGPHGFGLRVVCLPPGLSN